MPSTADQDSLKKTYLIEIAVSIGIVAALELAYYLAADEDFSLSIYGKSVLEVYIAPIYPGLYLLYPPIILLFLFGLLMSLANKTNNLLRRTGVFILILTWAGLGFTTIVKYYG